MARALARLALSCVAVADATVLDHGERSLLQTWDNALEHGSGAANDTPVTRVVNLLKEMSKTLTNEMEEDEALYDKLSCWCSNNKYEKDAAIEAATAKVAELKSTIEQQTAHKAELKATLADLENSLAGDKKTLAQATALREKQVAQFHKADLDSTQSIENLKAAITVLSKHHSAPPESTVAGGAVFKSERDSWDTSFLSLNAHGFPWRETSSDARIEDKLDDFMRANGFHINPQGMQQQPPAAVHVQQKFLQQGSGALDTDSAVLSTEWSAVDLAIVQRAMKSASSFVQAHHAEEYQPAYNAQSGEIMGVMLKLKEEMEAGLAESQKQEAQRAADFADLRDAKVAQIESQEKMSEMKEDELANTVNTLAEAKEDLTKEEASLAADQKFMQNLGATCATADKDFEARKAARMAEIKAVSETISILHGDQARDAMSSTFGFMQVATSVSRHEELRRRDAAAALRQTAKKVGSPELSILATSVELDAFTRVKKAIDEMVAALRQQQADEVKKTDWCKEELHQNEMTTARNTDEKSGQEAAIAVLQSDLKSLKDGIADAAAQISKLQLELQRASEDRKRENMDFQKTIADQTTTIEVLHKALDKLAKFYDMMQVQAHAGRQTPPVPQKEYEPSKGAGGVMEMIEKLANDAKELMAAAKHSENEAQAAYEQTVADTNGSVEALQKEIVSKTQAKGKARKDERSAQSDLDDTNKEIEGLAKYNGEMHAECDYVLKNFDVRQSARSQEVEALQQAKQILSGASMS